MQYDKSLMSLHLFSSLFNKKKTAEEIFSELHKDLAEKGSHWLTSEGKTHSGSMDLAI